jgi:hypothetical protein
VALALTEATLQRLGATPYQLDRARDRAHSELFGTSPDPPSGLPAEDSGP